MSEAFDTSAKERLDQYNRKSGRNASVERLTPDASTREFFRLEFGDSTAIACVYPERIDESLPQIDVTNLFLNCKLPVARILDVDYDLGLILHEDFGDNILRDVLASAEPKKREALLNQSISLIAKIQESTPKALELRSIASRLKFDEEKLLWELDFFIKHYFGSLKNAPLPEETEFSLTKEFTSLSRELEGLATVLTHRDFHAANLMVDSTGKLRIIDHQDARIGSVAYDLVSLLLDRITGMPSEEWLRGKKDYFLAERELLGLEKIESDFFDYEFDLMTVQRCLKAIGTFSNQAGNFGKSEYIEYINPMFDVVRRACKRIDRFPVLQQTIRKIIV